MNEAEVLQFREGLNVGLSPIRKGGPNFEFASLYLNKDRGTIGVKSDGAGTQRTAVYETRTYGGVRGSPRQFIWWGSLLDYQQFLFYFFEGVDIS
jgi:hypothetical protein